jgi:hypothetical protein
MAMSRKKNREKLTFGVCVNNKDYPASLELMKLYQIVADAEAEAEGMLRVIDESGESYLYNASRFILVNVPEEVETAYAQLALCS